MFFKAKRTRSEKNLKEFRSKPCLVCNSLGFNQTGPSQPAHITSRGAGGGDEKSNLMTLCFKHHREQHDIGFSSFVLKYPSVKLYLQSIGRQDVLAKAAAIL